MNKKNIALTVLYSLLGLIFIVSMVLAISIAFQAPYALNLEHYITVDLAYYDFDLQRFCQTTMFIVAAVLIVVLVFFDERASRKLKKGK